MKLKNFCIRGFPSHPLDVPSNYWCKHTERNRTLYGSANWSRGFKFWQRVELPVIWDEVTFMWRRCKEMTILLLCHTGDLLIRMRQPLYLHMSSLWLFHYSDVIWAPSRLISPATWLLIHVFLLHDNNGNPKAPLTVRSITMRFVHRGQINIIPAFV